MKTEEISCPIDASRMLLERHLENLRLLVNRSRPSTWGVVDRLDGAWTFQVAAGGRWQRIFATPFYDGGDGLPVGFCDDDGNEVSCEQLDWGITGNLAADAASYVEAVQGAIADRCRREEQDIDAAVRAAETPGSALGPLLGGEPKPHPLYSTTPSGPICESCAKPIPFDQLGYCCWTDFVGRDRCACEACQERSYDQAQEAARESGGAAAEQAANTDLYLKMK
jgi:hypothetical protein